MLRRVSCNMCSIKRFVVRVKIMLEGLKRMRQLLLIVVLLTIVLSVSFMAISGGSISTHSFKFVTANNIGPSPKPSQSNTVNQVVSRKRNRNKYERQKLKKLGTLMDGVGDTSNSPIPAIHWSSWDSEHRHFLGSRTRKPLAKKSTPSSNRDFDNNPERFSFKQQLSSPERGFNQDRLRHPEKTHPSIKLKEKIVHFDLKGAPPKVGYYLKLFPILRKAGATGVLLEYEDMFPYEGKLKIIRNGNAYSKRDIATIQNAATDNGLSLIPLIQTFGHMEYLLKHEQFRDLREVSKYPQSICPSNPKSAKILRMMIDQVVAFHANLQAFHIGADEAFQVGQDALCLAALHERFQDSTMNLMLEHVTGLAKYLRNKHKIGRVLVWNDMFQMADVETMELFKMDKLVEPVIWGYSDNVQQMDYFPEGMFERFAQVFPNMWIASAFKGANGPSQPFIDVDRYFRNHQSWIGLLKEQSHTMTSTKTAGIILTGWQRFDHFASLCELFAVGTPSLIANLLYLKTGISLDDSTNEMNEILNCDRSSIYSDDFVDSNYQMFNQIRSSNSERGIYYDSRFVGCQFPGAQIHDSIFKLQEYRNYYDSFEKSPETSGWLSEYHLNHAYGQVYRAEHAYNQTEAIRVDLIQLGSQLRRQMSELYFEETINEWLFSNIQVQLNRIKRMADGCLAIMSSRSFSRRPLSNDTMDF